MARTARRLAGLALAALLPALPAAAEEIEGAARIIDGDTLAIGAVHVRLSGIDAPESHQRCGGATGTDWDCGKAAAARLTTLTSGAAVRCDGDSRDRYDRLIATCRVGDDDLGREMVAEGLARAYVRYSDAYVADEAAAQRRGLGLWQGTAEAPWDYRAEAWRPAAGVAAAPVAAVPPPGCTIKGNITRSGARIYHLPGGPSYARTRIDPGRGEAWFCDEAAAQAAGFRPPRAP